MSNQGRTHGNVRLLSGSQEDANEPLQTIYYCQAERRKTLDVVIELKGPSETSESIVPQRFVLVIDVSGSMDGIVHADDQLSLLERMKLFAIRFIETTTSMNWLSIVVFSTDASTMLSMTQMDENGKNLAKSIVGNLRSDDVTNLSAGLFLGLDEAAGSYQGYSSHDCIILFTDGGANRGIVDSTSLVNEYFRRMEEYKRRGRVNNVQLAAITVDGYKPRFLNEIRKELSSDAFYVLNLDCDFEADMLIPLFLRQSSCISDITIDLNCLEGVAFNPYPQFKPGLVTEDGNVGRRYFIYTLPGSVVKHIYISLDISRLSNDRNIILHIKKAYLDPSLKPRTSEEFLQLDLTPMIQVREEANISAEISAEGSIHLEEFCAYIFMESKLSVSWESAELAFAKVLKQKGRQSTYSSLEQSCICVLNQQTNAAAQELSQSISKIEELQQTAITVLGEKSIQCRMLRKNLNDYIKNLDYGAVNIESISWGRFQAMLSSIETEMPTATGVFEPESSQPFMPPQIEEKLVESTKILGERRLKQDNARKQLNEAINARNFEMIQKALENCMSSGVDEATLLKAENFLKIIEKEDILIKDISLYLRKNNVANLQKSIATFRAVDSKFVDKTGVVKKAEKHVHDVLEKQRLMKLKEDTIEKIKMARKNENDGEMEDLIKELEAAPLRALVDINFILEAKDDLNRLRREIALQSKVKSLTESINQLILTEDLPVLENKLNELSRTVKDRYYKKNIEIEKFLKSSFDTLSTLQEKQKLRNELEKAWKGFELPLVPDSLDSLKASIVAVEELKVQAEDQFGGFTKKDEEKLQKHTKAVEDLEIKISQRDEAHRSLNDALDNRDYEELKTVLKQINKLSFLDENLVHKCKDLRDFLNPKKRREVLLKACKTRDIKAIEKAISDFNKANVTKYPDDLKKAEKRLKKLKHIENLNHELREAMVEQDIPRLRMALQQCEESRIHNNDIPLYSEAQELLTELVVEELKNILQEAVESRNLSKLAEALKQVEDSGYQYRLADEYDKAKALFEHLLELYRLREKILKMDETVMSEIKNYAHPPVLVQTIMRAVFLTLGETPQTIKSWPNIQKLMRQAMKKRIQECMPQNVDASLRKKVNKYVVDLNVDDVEGNSKGVATFFAWVKCMLAESSYFNPE